MNVLRAGGGVAILRFLPDGRRLLAGVTDTLPFEQDKETTVRFEVLPLDGGDLVPLDLPRLRRDDWWYAAGNGNAVAIHPDGDRVYVAWAGHLYACRTAGGERLPAPPDPRGHQVAVSPDGRRLGVVAFDRSDKYVLTVRAADDADNAVFVQRLIGEEFRQLVSFLPDGQRFAVIDGGRVCVRSADGRDEVASAKYPSRLAYYPTISPDGRLLGVAGYSSFYLYDLPGLGKPRTLGTGRASADVAGFAFHPDGRTLAIILGAPTLVKLYDVETLKLRGKLDWKLGPMKSVAFSPDGTLGAAGSADGRVVVWDVDG